jgi:hypothetical protein
MKLLFCPMCNDVHGLIESEWRMCSCGASGGQYNADHMTATLGGLARVFGIGNPFFNELYPFLDSAAKKKMQQKFYGHTDGEAWWGEYEGDQQIFRINDAGGPRLKVRVTNAPLSTQMLVIVVDKRVYRDPGGEGKSSVIVPIHPKANIKLKTVTKGKK